MERAARRGCAARGGSQVTDGHVEITRGDRGARGVVMHHVAHDAEIDRALGGLARAPETTRLEMREVELTKEHRLRRAIERRARRETSTREARSRHGVPRDHGAT